MMDDRAVSSVIGYVLALGITALLVGTLLVGGASVVEERSNTVQHDQLQLASHDLGEKLRDADRLNETTDGGYSMTVSLPTTVDGEPYSVRITNTSTEGIYELTASTDDGDVEVTTRVTVVTPIDTPTTVSGGDVKIAYNPSKGALEVTNDA